MTNSAADAATTLTASPAASKPAHCTGSGSEVQDGRRRYALCPACGRSASFTSVQRTLRAHRPAVAGGA
jgi:hypothetical protein